MTEFEHLLAAAFKTERAAARRLAAGAAMSGQEALRRTLERSAGAAGLAALLQQRAALQSAAAERLAQRQARQAASLAQRQARHDGAPTPWRAWFDGSAHPNPGRCGIGGLLTGPGGERIEISEAAGYGDSCHAEYRALIAVLEAALRSGAQPLTVYGDSQVVVDDVNGSDAAKAPALAEYRGVARALIGQLAGVTLRWVPRHKNSDADALSQRAIRQHQGELP